MCQQAWREIRSFALEVKVSADSGLTGAENSEEMSTTTSSRKGRFSVVLS